jgi:hypothetical protein
MADPASQPTPEPADRYEPPAVEELPEREDPVETATGKVTPADGTF